MKVAVAKYPIGEPRDFEAFAARQEALLREAKAGGARLAVLPEYLWCYRPSGQYAAIKASAKNLKKA